MYYTPKIEDLFIGYECELLFQSDNKLAKTENYKWHKTILDKNNFQRSYSLLKGNKIRCLKLNKELIIADGFSELDNGFLEKGNIKCIVYENGTIQIEEHRHRKDEFIFYGYCPSINEFRKITNYVTHTDEVSQPTGRGKCL